ncbi:hypothetical protein OZ411_06680 [Bradyrhizobium sp. Arg237L]|uniref:hypothetical protein n=1 Tax=Bradyrhizobium sp. Arg237L TaxID=3003352 RepID=UPI00249E81A5|nr:hypothetical protein [Bradyrhizobium sp. Arg237L]MDI4232496.1 hypothetical protein [Bradyrhizobium sp. Arg237L]
MLLSTGSSGRISITAWPPNEDTLLILLNALHSLNDRLQKEVGRNFFASSNFIALKALRNLFHHHTELIHEVKIIPVENLPPMVTDLLTVCLVPRTLIERAGTETDRKYREQVRSAFDAFKWYGSIVNIQPCVFNVAVDVFELVADLDAAPQSEAYLLFMESYRLEEQDGHDHRVTGDIWCGAGSVAEILGKVFHQTS